MNNKIAIIIVTYNGTKWIRECLNSCQGYDVVVVDNNSTDDTVKIIKEEFSDVILIEKDENLGFGKANNLGISYALNNGFDYVFLLNQDAYIIDKCIEDLIEVYNKNKNYGILSPVHLNKAKNQLDRNFANYVTKNPDFVEDFLLKKTQREVYEVPFVNAAAWFLTKEVLMDVGGFDPIFFHYAEDNNYCQRVIYHNYKIGVVSNSFVIHDREFREKKHNLSTQEKLIIKERDFKKKYANINLDLSLEPLLKKLKRRIIKRSLRLDFNAVNTDLIEYKLVDRIKKIIERSRLKNSSKAPHYLDVKN